MKKIIVIGCNGMAGHVVKNYLKSLNLYDVWGIARGVESKNNIISLDVTNIVLLEKIIENHAFDIVINCIGLLNKTAEDRPDMAIWLNSYFPHLLAFYGNIYKYKLIHISTDCVFSGKEGSYVEDSFKNGVGFYAQSKALGEIINDKDLTFRTSIIGPELKKDGIGLFHWFMNQEREISGYTKVFWTGVTTIELAKAIDNAIQEDLNGLYHLVNNIKISKYNLLKIFTKIFDRKDIHININDSYEVDKSLINRRKDFNYSIPDYERMIMEMREWMLNYKEIYSHYQPILT